MKDGLGISIAFGSALEARKFMNRVYDTLIVSIRSEVGKNWKP